MRRSINLPKNRPEFKPSNRRRVKFEPNNLNLHETRSRPQKDKGVDGQMTDRLAEKANLRRKTPQI